jgi:hypothetical protein
MIYSLTIGAIFLTWVLLRILGGERESQINAARVRIESEIPAPTPKHPNGGSK